MKEEGLILLCTSGNGKEGVDQKGKRRTVVGRIGLEKISEAFNPREEEIYRNKRLGRVSSDAKSGLHLLLRFEKNYMKYIRLTWRENSNLIALIWRIVLPQDIEIFRQITEKGQFLIIDSLIRDVFEWNRSCEENKRTKNKTKQKKNNKKLKNKKKSRDQIVGKKFGFKTNFVNISGK